MPEAQKQNPALDEVVDYWNTHLNATQFLGQRSLDEGTAAFFDAIEQSYLRFPYKQKLFDQMAKLSGKALLEIGCGLGNDLVELAGRGFEVTGIDLAPRAVDLARRHLKHRGLTGKVEVANCEALPFDEGSFDMVYSTGVIQHTPDIDAAVAELFRVVRPGGRLVIILYHRYSWFNLLATLSGKAVEFDGDDAPIVRTFSRRQLRRMFTAAQELTVTMEHYRPKPTPRGGVMSSLYNKAFVPAYSVLPTWLIRPFGWHAVVQGRKELKED